MGTKRSGMRQQTGIRRLGETAGEEQGQDQGRVLAEADQEPGAGIRHPAHLSPRCVGTASRSVLTKTMTGLAGAVPNPWREICNLAKLTITC